MIFDVLRLRDKGWLLPKFRWATMRPIRAELRIGECRDTELGRHVRRAQLVDPDSGAELAPALYDVQIVATTRDCMTLSGIERIEDDRVGTLRDYAQSWALLPVDRQEAAMTPTL